MRRGIQRMLPWLLLLPAVVPLMYADGLLYPYVTLKTLLFRALGIGALAIFAYLALSNTPLYWQRLKQKMLWIPGLLLAVAYATSLLGLDFYHSFWSTFERGDGLLTMTCIVGFFYMALLFVGGAMMRRIVTAVIYVATIVSAYTCLQWLQEVTGMDIPFIEIPRGRFGATLGNAAYLASYLGLTFFLTLGLIREYVGHVRSLKWLKFLCASLVLQCIAILLAATRGTLLALALSSFVALVYLAWKGVPGAHANARWRTYARYMLAASLAAAALFFVFREQLKSVPIEAVQRVVTMSLSEGTVSSRFFVWRNVFSETLTSAPIIGYGAEHVDAVFDKIYDPMGIKEEWFDRSHNAFLDYFVQYGFFGFLLYALLIVAFLHRSARMFRGGNEMGAFLFLFGLTYVIQNIFVFDTAITLWLFLMMLASTYTEEGTAYALARMPKLPHLVPAGAALVLLALIIPVSIQPLRANALLARGYVYHIAEIDRAVLAMQQGLDLETYADLEYGYNLYQMYTERQMTMLSGNERLTAYRFAQGTLRKNYERYSYDARTVVYYAHILDVAPSEMPAQEEELRSVIAQAIKLSPKHMQPWYLLANISIRKGDLLPQGSAEKKALYEEGIATLSEYTSQVQGLAEPQFVIATLYQTIGNAVSAKEWADKALLLYTPDLATAKRAARFFLNAEDWSNAVFFLREVMRGEPENYSVQYDLAKAEFLNGNIKEAVAIVERLREEAPGLVETDPEFLAALEGR